MSSDLNVNCRRRSELCSRAVGSETNVEREPAAGDVSRMLAKGRAHALGDADEVLDQVQEAERDPVGQPLLVVGGAGRVERAEREVRRQSPAEQVGQEAWPDVSTSLPAPLSATTDQPRSARRVRGYGTSAADDAR